MKVKDANVGELIDARFNLREKRKEVEVKVKEIKKKEAYLDELISLKLKDQGLKRGEGKLATAKVTTKSHPTIKDYDALTKFALRRKDFTIFQRRLNEGRIEELKNELPKHKVPGIEFFDKTTLSITKGTK